MNTDNTTSQHSDRAATFALETVLFGFIGAGAAASFVVGLWYDFWITCWEEVAYRLSQLFAWLKEIAGAEPAITAY